MDDASLIDAVLSGDSSAFEKLVAPETGRLKNFILRMVTNPSDADDLVQETLMQAHQKLSTFKGQSKFSTWLFAIASRKSIDHLRKKKRWPRESQLLGQKAAHEHESMLVEMQASTQRPDFSYAFTEHMAFCFSCIGRMLAPEDAAALVLREVFEFSNQEGAKAMGMSHSVYRHHVAGARKSMQGAYQGLCALVGKQGACYQCNELREFCSDVEQGPEPEQLGEPTESLQSLWEKRVARVRRADLAEGGASELHRIMFRFMSELHG